MGNLNTPSYNFLIPREHRIRAIQELYDAINKGSGGGGGDDVQIQSDWNQTDSTKKDYIKNKPTIPVVPINVSAFTNDAGYLTQHQDISGKADKIAVLDHGTNDTTFNLTPNVFHKWGEVASLTLTLASGTAGYLSEYMFEFISGSTATVLSLPNNIQFPESYEIEANKRYQVSIVNDIGLIVGVDYE